MNEPGTDPSFPPRGEMSARIRAFDWAATPLGPRDGWPRSLSTALSIVLGSRYPMFLWWGPKLINFYNDPYIPVLGKRHPDALGRPAREVWSEIWDTLGPQAEIVLRENSATWNEDLLLVMQRNGYVEETFFTFSYSPVLNDAGEVGGVFCACNETTARVLGERRLATLRQLAATSRTQSPSEACENAARILGQNPRDVPFALVYLLDPDGRRARLEACVGAPAGAARAPETVGLGADDDAGHPWPFAEALRGRPVVLAGLHARLDLPGGPWPEPANTAVLLPLPGPQGQPIGVLVAGISPRRALDDAYRGFLDLVAGSLASAVTDARAYEEERARAAALAELDRAKTAFFSNVSHELRTPLTLLLGPVEEELRRADPPSENLLTALRNGRRLHKLVNTLLDFSRIEAGRLHARFIPVDLATFTAELASGFHSAMEKAGLRFTVDCPPLPEPVFVDRDLWEKIVLNLVANALKYTLAGSVGVSLRARGDRVELVVADTGSGIPPEELPRVFDRFYRARGTAARSHEGTGIGLSLVRELAHLHGGEVSATSTVGVGSTFTVTVPLGAAHLPPEQVEPMPTPGPAAPPGREEPGDGNLFIDEAGRWLPDVEPPLPAPRDPSTPAPRVLVADDNPDMRAYLRRLLGRDFAVEVAADGQSALEAIRRAPPDLVVSDVMMPRLGGFALLHYLRADERTRAIPVVLLSARAGEEARVDGLNAGADDYLVKPFGARELLARVRSQLELAKLRRESAEQVSNILENITDAFHSIDAEGRYRRLNAAARRLLAAQGVDAASLLGKNIFEAFPALRGTPGGDALENALLQRVPTTAESFYPPWRRWHWIRNHPLPDGGVATFVQDITERKQTEERLRRAHAELEALYAQSPVGMAQLDRELRYVRINEMLARTNGLPPEAHIGRTLREVVPDIAPKIEPIFRGVLETGEPQVEAELRGVTKAAPGRECTWLQSCFPLRDAGGGIIGLNVVVQDITARKEAERALRASDERHRAFIANSTEGIWRLEFDPPIDVSLPPEEQVDLAYRHGRFAECNEVMARMYGLAAPHELVGRSLEVMLPSSDPAARAYLEKIVRSGYRVSELESTERDVAGNTLHFANSMAGMIEDGRLRVLWGTQRDITGRKRAEEEIRRAEERFRSLVGIVADVSWTMDAKGRFVAPQAAWEHYTGQPWERQRDFGWTEAVHPDDREQVLEQWRAARRDRSLLRARGRLWHAGTRAHRHFVARARPLLAPDGSVREWIAACTDVHEQRMIEEKLEALVAERTTALEEKIAEMETFSYSIAHDMRAPLRSMRGFSEILLEEHLAKLPADAQELLRRIAASATRMDRLIQDILGYSRVMQGAPPREKVDLAELLRGVLESYPQFAPARADIRVEGALPPVLGSEAMFTQVFSNLLGNAVKFVAPGTKPSVRIWAEEDGDRVRIHVRDNGIGIDGQQHEKVFAIFQQVDRNSGGTGIGLAIVRKAVERMGGQVGLVSELGRGSTFVLDLQRA